MPSSVKVLCAVSTGCPLTSNCHLRNFIPKQLSSFREITVNESWYPSFRDESATKTQKKRKFDDDIYPSVRTPRNSPPCDLFRINIISLRILSPKFFRGKEENFCITHLAIVPHPPSIREDPYLPGSARIKRGNGPTDLTPRYNLKDRGKSIYAVSIRKITKVSIR